jgi:hypothetical protein
MPRSKTKRGSSLPDWKTFIQRGGVRQLEHEAAAAAVRDVQALWLGTLTDWQQQEIEQLHHTPRSNLQLLAYLTSEVKRLRRALSIRPSPAVVREQTRKRVQTYRERQRRAAS